jgi:hypothetical protein
MPYVLDKIKILLNTNIVKAKEDGDYNYLYEVAYLREFIREPRYKTIALIRKASIEPGQLPAVNEIEKALLSLYVPELDLKVARDLAFFEFYRRTASIYEDFAIEKNGDLVEFQAAEALIMEKLDDFYRSL